MHLGSCSLRVWHSRVVLVDVDVVEGGLLQAEQIDNTAMEDVAGLGEELVEAPALLLVSLQDVSQHRGQKALQAPGEGQRVKRQVEVMSRHHINMGGYSASPFHLAKCAVARRLIKSEALFIGMSFLGRVSGCGLLCACAIVTALESYVY